MTDSENKDKSSSSRGRLSRLGFVAAAAGTAVGLGNIWRFPFEVAKGGGAAFLLIYIAFCFLLCFPLMVTEIAIGRKAQRDASGAFTVLGFPKWGVLGKMGIMASVLGLSLYNVIAAWVLGYMVEITMGNFGIGEHFAEYIKDIPKVGGYALLFIVVTAFIVSRGISNGIEKASKLMMPALVIMIFLLAGYALTLPHALEGISFYLVPDFSKFNLSSLSTALGMCFFSLSLGMGAHITLGSYTSGNDNIVSSALWVTFIDSFVAFLAGLMMFPFVAYLTGGVMDDIQGGPNLIFVTLPGVFASFGPAVGSLVGGAFFLLLSFAALTTTVALLEVPVAYLVDGFQVKRNVAVWSLALFIFSLGIPPLLGNGYSHFFTNFIQYGSSETPTDFLTFLLHINDAIMLSGSLLISIFAAYVWRRNNLSEEISMGYAGYRESLIEKFLNIMIAYFCPVVLSIILFMTILDRYFAINPN